MLVELGALDQAEQCLEELSGTQGGAELLDRDGVLGAGVAPDGARRAGADDPPGDVRARRRPAADRGVERRPDPSDGRAKLICLTDAGWDAMRTARRSIAEIEAEYAELVGAKRFEASAETLDELLRALDSRAG